MFSPLLLLPLLVGLVHSETFQGITQLITTSSGTYNGFPAEYLDTNFDVEFSVDLNLTDVPQDILFEIDLQASGGSYVASSNCKYKSDGTSFGCRNSRTAWTCTPVNINQVQVSVGSYVQIQGNPIKTEEDANTITIQLLNAVADTNSADNLVDISFPAYIAEDCKDTLYDITLWASNNLVPEESSSKTASVRAIGPILGSSSDETPATMVTPGQQVDFNVRISHVSASTESAYNPEVGDTMF